MKKIYTTCVSEFNKRTKRYELIENESDWYYIDDDASISYCGGAPSGGGGGGGTQTTQTVEKSDPWEGQQPYLTKGFQNVESAFLNSTPQFYPGSTVTPYSPETNLALQLQTDRAINGSPIQEAGTNQLSDTLNGAYLGQARSQYDNSPMAGYVKEALTPTLQGDFLHGGDGFNSAVDAASRKIIPQVQSMFEKSGRSNSGLAQIGMTQALGDSFAQQYGQERQNQLTAANSANTSNQSYLDMLSQERENQIRSMLFAPQMASLDYQDYSKLAEVGAQREALDQQNLYDQIARWDYEQNQKRNSAAGYMNLVQGNYGGQSTGTSTSNMAGNSGGGGMGLNFMGGLGGLLAAPLMGMNPLMGLLGGII